MGCNAIYFIVALIINCLQRHANKHRIMKNEIESSTPHLLLADVKRRKICPRHKQIKLGYLAWFHEAEKRARKGMKQKQCPDCGYWLWKDEYSEGWRSAAYR